MLVCYGWTGSLQTIGGALIRGGAVNWRITVYIVHIGERDGMLVR